MLAESLREEKWPRDIVEERGLAQVSDEGALAAVVDEVLAANADAVAEYRAGDDKTQKKKRGFLFGQIMRARSRRRRPADHHQAPFDRLASGLALRTSSGASPFVLEHLTPGNRRRCRGTSLTGRVGSSLTL